MAIIRKNARINNVQFFKEGDVLARNDTSIVLIFDKTVYSSVGYNVVKSYFWWNFYEEWGGDFTDLHDKTGNNMGTGEDMVYANISQAEMLLAQIDKEVSNPKSCNYGNDEHAKIIKKMITNYIDNLRQ